MKIEGNTIIFKSEDEFYFKERDGIKPKAIRKHNQIVNFGIDPEL